MYLLGLGIVLLILKYGGLGPVAQWGWWLVLTPFALAVVWWAWADWSGYTKRKVVEREEERRQERIEKTRIALGQASRKKRN